MASLMDITPDMVRLRTADVGFDGDPYGNGEDVCATGTVKGWPSGLSFGYDGWHEWDDGMMYGTISVIASHGERGRRGDRRLVLMSQTGDVPFDGFPGRTEWDEGEDLMEGRDKASLDMLRGIVADALSEVSDAIHDRAW